MASTELRAAAQQALEACKLIVSAFDALKPASAARNEPLQINAARASITALEAALAEPQEPDSPERRCGGPGCDLKCCQPVQEPVAYVDHADGSVIWKRARLPGGSLLYTSPPQPAEPVEDTDDKAASIRWQLCLLAQTEEFSDDVRNQIGRGVWLIDRLRAALAEPQEPVQEPVVQISANRVIAAIEEWKSLWWKVPPFASKVNRATREAITVSHNPLFALLLDAQAAKQMPKGCTTPSGCQQHGCHGECLPAPPQHPAQPPQDHFPDATKMVQEPVQETEMRRCPRCWEPMFPPQPTPLTVERLRDALVASRIVPPAAVEDPDGYDDGVTLHRIEALHRRLA